MSLRVHCALTKTSAAETRLKSVLNVGGDNKKIPLPSIFDGWTHVLLDIDPAGKPDVVCDARDLTSLPGGEYDAVYCSHNLEHYHRHEVARVLAGFRHVIKPDGFVFVRVPDIAEVMQLVAERDLDIDDVLYRHELAGDITVHDVLYGFGPEIEHSGNDFYAHKTGFTTKSLTRALQVAGFAHVYFGEVALEIQAFGFTQEPTAAAKALMNLG
jgi:SAM-dependent methyltransferase